MTDREKEIAERVEKATPGEWHFRNGHSRNGDPIDLLCAEVARMRELLAKGTHPFGACRSDREPDLCGHCDRVNSTEAECALVEGLCEMVETCLACQGTGISKHKSTAASGHRQWTDTPCLRCVKPIRLLTNWLRARGEK